MRGLWRRPSWVRIPPPAFMFEKGIIVEVNDVKQAINVDKFANGVLIREFDLELIGEIIDAISLPVIASCRIGHFVEAKLLEKLGVAMVDESIESKMKPIDKKNFSVPFMCKVNDAIEAKKRIEEGAKAIRTSFGNIDEIAGIVKEIKEEIKDGAMVAASLKIATPADISLLFQVGCDSIIISSDLFRSPNPPQLLDALIKAARYYNEIDKILNFSKTINKILPSSK